MNQISIKTAIVITIGDELIYGQRIDTNGPWLAQQLYQRGIKLLKKSSIADREDVLIQELDESMQLADLVITTGGLGPTADDKTKDIVTQYFGSELVFNQKVYDHIFELFRGRDLAYLERNKAQANVPKHAKPLLNSQGTAPGLLFEKEGKYLLCLPGVPYEMKGIFNEEFLPSLRSQDENEHTFLCTAGMGESYIAEIIHEVEESLPEEIRLAYLPSPGKVKVRLSYPLRHMALALKKVAEIDKLISKVVYHIGEEIDLEEKLFQILKERKEQVALAESCTGGRLAAKFTNLSGVSDVFMGSVVTYSYNMKEKLLGVSRDTLNKYGAVSEETVGEMLDGIKSSLEISNGIAISGIAGPGGGTKEKPVGLVVIGVMYHEKRIVKTYLFNGRRSEVMERACVKALEKLYSLVR